MAVTVCVCGCAGVCVVCVSLACSIYALIYGIMLKSRSHTARAAVAGSHGTELGSGWSGLVWSGVGSWFALGLLSLQTLLLLLRWKSQQEPQQKSASCISDFPCLDIVRYECVCVCASVWRFLWCCSFSSPRCFGPARRRLVLFIFTWNAFTILVPSSWFHHEHTSISPSPSPSPSPCLPQRMKNKLSALLT